MRWLGKYKTAICIICITLSCHSLVVARSGRGCFMFLWFCAYPFITKSEVVRGKSQTEVNTSRPMSKISLYYDRTGEVIKVIYFMVFSALLV